MIALDKLVALRCRDQTLVDRLCKLADDDLYAPTLAEVERIAAGGAGDAAKPEVVELYQELKEKTLLDLFRGEPKLSGVARDDLLNMASFCDVQPDPNTMFRTTDPVFMRLVDLSKQGPVVVTKLMLDDFCQLAVVDIQFPELWDRFRDLAKANWTKSMLAIEQFLSDRQTTPGDPSAASLAQAAAGAVKDGSALAAIMLTPPRFSGMLAKEVLAYDDMRAGLPEPDSLIDKQFTPNPSPFEKGRALAKLVLAALPAARHTAIEGDYMIRLEALRELTRRRFFVKRDILEHFWPSVYDRMRRDFAGMVQFEKQIQRPESCTEEELVNLRPYLQDDRLVRVLKSQPYFGHLTDGPPPSSNDAPASGQGMTPTATFPDSRPPVARPRPQDTPAALSPISASVHPYSGEPINAPSLAEVPQVHYDDIYLEVERSPEAPSGYYRVTATIGDRIVTHDNVKLNWSEIREQVRHLQFSRGTADEVMLSAHPDYTSQLKKLGLTVYDSLFKGPVREELLRMLGSTRNLRLHWLGDQADQVSAALPWESLYVPSAPVSFLALTRRYSLVRRSGVVKSMPVSAIGPRLRLLFVTASPSRVAPLPGIEQEIETVKRVLASSGQAELQVVQEADVERVNHIMREFRPHVFHFSGHGVFRSDAEAGELLFQTSSGTPHLVTSHQLAVMLYENDVSIAVLNGCDTGVSSTNDAVSSVAGALVKAGVPAVVATLREVMDEAATRFSREFYRSLISGFTVEGCMGEARKALSFDNWDWSAYALFVGSADLDKLRVLGPVRSQR